VASCSGAAVNATSLIRPATVQIEIRRSAICQDSIRSSYGCAPSGRKTIGFSLAFR
jgi:hypothetical protein